VNGESRLVSCLPFDPDVPHGFDAELNDAIMEFARRHGRFAGHCSIAGAPTEFIVASENTREDLVASVSGSTNRQRQVIATLANAMLGSPAADLSTVAAEINRRKLSVYIAEALSLPAIRLRELVEDFECSEYFGEDHRSGNRVDGILHQDLQATSFADGRFDIVITSDVLEHVPDALAAEREICRILKPGGLYCFTVPFMRDADGDLVRAERRPGGEVIHHLEREYHTDPIRPGEGALVYRIFSHRGLRARFTALGCAFTTYWLWSKALGIIGENCFTMVARKTTRAR